MCHINQHILPYIHHTVSDILASKQISYTHPLYTHHIHVHFTTYIIYQLTVTTTSTSAIVIIIIIIIIIFIITIIIINIITHLPPINDKYRLSTHLILHSPKNQLQKLHMHIYMYIYKFILQHTYTYKLIDTTTTIIINNITYLLSFIPSFIHSLRKWTYRKIYFIHTNNEEFIS